MGKRRKNLTGNKYSRWYLVGWISVLEIILKRFHVASGEPNTGMP
jgi:hypothetical protein